MKLNERIHFYFQKEKNMLSIDESIIPYRSGHDTKQFTLGKLLRFGYKMLGLTSPLGYVLQFEPYQGVWTTSC